MSRQFNEIQEEILGAVSTAQSLSAMEILTTHEQVSITSTSKVSIWRTWVWIIAYAIFKHEKIVDKNAENSRPHNLPWYREQAMNFLDGLSLQWIDGQFKYNLVGVEDAADRKIIDRVAVLESLNGELVFKIATDNAGTIEPVSPDQLLRFKEYMRQIKDAGNRLRFINEPADLIKSVLKIYVDPLIIDLTTGKLLSSSSDVYPVKDAINNFLANLEFNGAFVVGFYQDAIQKALGVKLAIIEDLQHKYAGFPFEPVVEWKVPNAGYFKINDTDSTINYLPYDLAAN
jgi:hypothetical protein